MQIEPLFNWILVKPSSPESQSRGGIIIPENAQKRMQEGTVLAVGPGERHQGNLIPMSVVVGDYILFSPSVGVEVEWDGAACLLLRESELIARKGG